MKLLHDIKRSVRTLDTRRKSLLLLLLIIAIREFDNHPKNSPLLIFTEVGTLDNSCYLATY
jgi:hypothetical protein